MEQTQQQSIALEEAIPVGTLICVIRDVLRRWYLMVMVALIAAMGAFVVSDLTYTPQYTSSATLVITSGSTFTTTYQNLTATTEAAAVFSEILNSSLLQRKVSEETGITGFDGSITSSVVNGTNLLTMTVSGGDPRTVFLMSKSLLANHSIVSAEVLGDVVIEVLQEPTIPSGPSNPKNTARNVRLALALGAAAVAALQGYYLWTADRIRSRTEADKKLPCRILGELYHERKARSLRDVLARRKTGILITNPLTSFFYTESIHKISGRIDKFRRKGQRVVMVTSLLENEGKSTVAVNLALSWAAKGRRVLLMDCDLRKPSCHKILEVADNGGLMKLLQGEGTLEDQTLAVPGSGLRLLSGGRGVRNASSLLSSGRLKALLQEATQRYDLVVVDTPPMALTPDAECIGELTNCALMITRQNTADVTELNDAIRSLEKTGTNLLGCVLNNVYGISTFAPAYYGGAYCYGKYGKYGKYKYGYYKYGYYKYGYGNHSKTKSSGEGEKGAV